MGDNLTMHLEALEQLSEARSYDSISQTHLHNARNYLIDYGRLTREQLDTRDPWKRFLLTIEKRQLVVQALLELEQVRNNYH